MINIFITTLFFLLSATNIYAAPVGMSIEPPILRAQIKPGKSITKVFNIQNTEDQDKNIIVRVVPFNKSDTHGNPIIDLKNTTPWLSYFGLSNANIKLGDPFLIRAKSKEQIILSIAVPENANLEDLYVTLLISTYDNSLEQNQKGTLISASIGANILVTVTSNLNPTTILKISKIIPQSGSFLKIGTRYLADSLTPITFSAVATNDGKFTTDTKGIFKVSKKSISLQLQGILPQYVLAKTSRTLINTEGKPFSFTPTINTFGTHTVSFDIRSENSNTSNSIEVVFLPFKALIAIFISLFIIKVVFSMTKK